MKSLATSACPVNLPNTIQEVSAPFAVKQVVAGIGPWCVGPRIPRALVVELRAMTMLGRFGKAKVQLDGQERPAL